MRIALIVPNNQSWKDRSSILCDAYRGEGWTTDVIPLKGNQEPPSIAGYDIVFNHALQANPVVVRQLAGQHRQVKFVHVNHSAMAHIAMKSRYADRICDIYHSTRQVENIWYASVEPTTLPDLPRAVQFPMIPRIREPRKYRYPDSPPVVAIAGRIDPIKNYYNQILAVKHAGARLAVCCPPEAELRNYIRAAEVDSHSYQWFEQDKWIEWLGVVPDVMLQVSLAESFSCIAAEAMQAGVPTITSTTIRFADPAMVTADPNNPHKIADLIREASGPRHEIHCRNAGLHSATVKTNSRRACEVVQAIHDA